MLLFDTLIRQMLPPYGGSWVHAPNFERLAKRSVVFDHCYGASMPCLPARRELHTGRYNFLHRSWGPLERFDDSMPEMLKRHGIYTHFISDHPQYWEESGSGYHTKFSTFEFFRGQAGDPWKGHVEDPDPPETLKQVRGAGWRQDWVNREYMVHEVDHPQTRVFDAGLEFIHTNRNQERWLLFIDAFDPHEPFFSYNDYQKFYTHDYTGPHFDWPDYRRVTEEPAVVEHLRCEYAALLTMCDSSLGRVLDAMDDLAMWDDTMLIVFTDHGLLLGEHDWWGKNVQPWYDETIHTPLFIWDPRGGARGQKRQSLVQTIDLVPTVLEFFEVEPTAHMQGASLRDTIAHDAPIRKSALFGVFGGHVCITDGRYVYMRASKDESNQPLFEYTLMPAPFSVSFSIEALRQSEFVEPFSFTKGLRTLRVPGTPFYHASPWSFGSLLFDLQADPGQHHPMVDDELELRMAQLLVELLRSSDAPVEQFARLGLPPESDVTEAHLLVRAQWAQVELSQEPIPTSTQFPQGGFDVMTPLSTLLADPDAAQIIRSQAPDLAAMTGPLGDVARELRLIDLAAMPWWLRRPQLERIATELSQLSGERETNGGIGDRTV